MTANVQLDRRATGHTAEWVEVRDEEGHLWCKYNPSRQVVQFYRNANSREAFEAEIAIDDLIAGKYLPTMKRIPRK